MALSIERANMGYDQVGLQQMIQKIHMEAIPNTCKTLASQAQNVASAIDGVWQGAAAAAFKQKLEDDTNTINQMLMDISAGIVEQLHQSGANVEAYDAAIAEELFGASNVVPGNGFATDMRNLGEAISKNPLVKFTTNIAKGYAKVCAATGATAGNLVMSVTEGLFNFGEMLVDGICYAGVGVASAATGIYDLATGSSTTKNMWQATLNGLGGSRTSSWFDSLYDTKVMKAMNDAALGPMQRGEWGYKAGKAVGVVAGNVVLGIATAGVANGVMGAASAAGAAGSSAAAASASVMVAHTAQTAATIATTAAAGLTGVSKSVDGSLKTMKGMKDENGNAIYDIKNLSGADIAKVMGRSVIDGGVDAAAWYLTYGGGIEKVAAGNKLIKGNAIKNGWQEAIGTDAASILAKSTKTINTNAKMVIQTTKNVVKEGASVLVDKDYNVGEVVVNSAIDSAVSFLYDKSIGKPVGKAAGDFVQKALESKTISNAAGAKDLVSKTAGKAVKGGVTEFFKAAGKKFDNPVANGINNILFN